MTITDLVARFVRWCEERRAPATVRLYRSRLKPFAAMFGDRELSTLTPLDIDDWLRKVDRNKEGELLAPDTRRSYRVAFKRLQSWSLEHKQISETIIEKIEMPRGRRRERIPTTSEILRILRPASRPFRLIYLALLRSGCRPNELCRATTEHIQATESGLRVIELREHKTASKTGKPRRIPIGKKLGRLIDKSLAGRSEGPLFLTVKGKVWLTSNLSGVFKRLRRRAGISEDLVLYCTRHHKGTNVCRKFGIKAAADVLGHSNLQTTQKYVHETLEEISEYQDAA